MELTIVPGPNGVTVVHPVGHIDPDASRELRQALHDAVAAGKHRLVVDLEGAHFDSFDPRDQGGLTGALISGVKAARRAGGELRIAHPEAEVKTILKMLRLERVVSIYRSVEEASANF